MRRPLRLNPVNPMHRRECVPCLNRCDQERFRPPYPAPGVPHATGGHAAAKTTAVTVTTSVGARFKFGLEGRFWGNSALSHGTTRAGRFGSTAVHPVSCGNRQQWVEKRPSDCRAERLTDPIRYLEYGQKDILAAFCFMRRNHLSFCRACSALLLLGGADGRCPH